MNTLNIYFLIILFYTISCNGQNSGHEEKMVPSPAGILTGAEQLETYKQLLEGQTIGLVVNHTALVGNKHLADTLISLGYQVLKIFAPEHGFRGEEDAGATIRDGIDKNSGLPVISLYGSKKKPTTHDLEGISLMIYDIQDVGVRFYTFISTLHYLMEACAEESIPLLVLDRPNPNGHYIDGPVLQRGFESFVGMHPVPVVYGMTVGEYARMIVGEKWINQADDLQLEVIPCKNYTHNTVYHLPVKPSPNLPNLKSVLLYPSLCFFEGTTVSVGRGTDHQFQVIGHPDLRELAEYSFTPEPKSGALNPPHKGIKCYGISFTHLKEKELYDSAQLNIHLLLQLYSWLKDKDGFFLKNNFFDKLAGTDQLRKQVIEGWTEAQIRQSWRVDLEAFMDIRAKYLIYD